MADRFMQRNGIAGDRIRYEQPSDKELFGELRGNGILFLAHGFSGGLAGIEHRTNFPMGTIPYLISGRPMLRHYTPVSFLSRRLREHDCAEVVELPDESVLRAALDRLRDDAGRRTELVKNALRAAARFRAADFGPEINRCLCGEHKNV